MDDDEWAAVTAHEHARHAALAARLARIEHVCLLDKPCEPAATELTAARAELARMYDLLPDHLKRGR